MKQFNKNKANRKINFEQNKSTYIKRISIVLVCFILLIGIIMFTFAKFESESEEYTLINGKVKCNICEYQLGKEWIFNYNGTNGIDGLIQSFNTPCNGEYRLEVWGAQGGTAYDGTQGPGGYGGYSTGVISLEKNDNILVNVGGAGTGTQNMCNDAAGGYNGGGNAYHWYNGRACDTYTGSGGGATDVRTSDNYYETTNIRNNGSSYYGPYWKTNAGHYQIDLYGSNLTNCSYGVYDNNNSNIDSIGPLVYSIYGKTGNDSRLTLFVYVDRDAQYSGLELHANTTSLCTITKEVFTKLEDRVIVAGGGGGSAYYSNTATQDKSGGAGGGIQGNQGSFPQRYVGLGGTQSAGGGISQSGTYTCNGCTPGTGDYGVGGNSSPTGKTGSITEMSGGAGGGAGYYGGGGSSIESTAGGGSGYIGSSRLLSSNGITKHMTCYNCTTSSVANTKTDSNTCHNSTATRDCAKEGNGYAKITLVSTPDIIRVPNN